MVVDVVAPESRIKYSFVCVWMDGKEENLGNCGNCRKLSWEHETMVVTAGAATWDSIYSVRMKY